MTLSTRNFEYSFRLQITQTIYFRYVRVQLHLFIICAIQKCIFISTDR